MEIVTCNAPLVLVQLHHNVYRVKDFIYKFLMDLVQIVYLDFMMQDRTVLYVPVSAPHVCLMDQTIFYALPVINTLQQMQ